MKISIITATYNSADTIRDTIESVLAQDYDNWEHIIVDGNSKDNTMEIVEDYSDRYKGRCICISEPDNGIYDAMNKGVGMATGKILGLLNSDDFFTCNDVLSTIARNFNDTDAVYGDIHFVDPSNLNKCVRHYSSKGFRRWKMRLGFMPAHPSFYCLKDIYERHGLFDTSYKIAADFEQLLRLIYIEGIKTRYVAKDFVTMRTGGASTNGLKSHLRIMREHRRAFRTHGLKGGAFLDLLRYPVKVLELIK